MAIIKQELLDNLLYGINELSLDVFNGKREIPAGLEFLSVSIENNEYIGTIPSGESKQLVFCFTLEGHKKGKVQINKTFLEGLYIPVLESIYKDIMELGE